ncbi:MAG: YezD family protein, partial [Candidatus Omnitrophica bacterium]|nr:YezD family protein [Candidatus Omnitrophota bacterium]
AIRSIHYGSVEIIIHDSKVVQVERTEKIRFEKENFSGQTTVAKQHS